jgi:hypothetical protein
MRMIKRQFKKDPLAGTFVIGLLAMVVSGLVFLAACYVDPQVMPTPFMSLMAISGVFTACVALPNYPWCAVQATRALQGKHYGAFATYSTLTLLSGTVAFLTLLFIGYFIGMRMEGPLYD